MSPSSFCRSSRREVLEGLKPGEQVVTFGSFFIDAEYQLKGS